MSAKGLSLEWIDKPVRRMLAKQNRNGSSFSKVICAGGHRQLELMIIPPGQEVRDKACGVADRILFVAEGKGTVLLDGDAKTISQQTVVFVPAGMRHQIRNLGSGRMTVFSVSSPPATSFIY